MKEEQIKEVLLQQAIRFVPHATIWGSIVADMGAYQNGFGTIMHGSKDHVLHFNYDGIAMIAINEMNGLLDKNDVIFIPKKQIIKITFRIRLMRFALEIKTEKGVIHYKIAKKIFLCPWHKENLSYILLMCRSCAQ